MNRRPAVSIGWAGPLALALACAIPGCSRPTAARHITPDAEAPTEDNASLVFRVEGHDVRTLSRDSLEEAAAPETVTGFDPYYNRTKTFLALPLDRVLNAGLSGAVHGPLAQQHFILRARDGYTVPIAGERLLDGTAYLAVRDRDVPGWEPIGSQHVNPGPFYLVWKGPDRASQEDFPRPWQLAAIEVASFASAFPHTVPTGAAPDSPEDRGFQLFAHECIRCHAINREGGRVGPELNVPQSIVAYRPVDQIRAYIRNPLTFRYGNMPAHPNFTDTNLDDLVAYFRAMARLPWDPARDAGTGDAGTGP